MKPIIVVWTSLARQQDGSIVIFLSNGTTMTLTTVEVKNLITGLQSALHTDNTAHKRINELNKTQ